MGVKDSSHNGQRNRSSMHMNDTSYTSALSWYVGMYDGDGSTRLVLCLTFAAGRKR
jgi:hypothetical protein